MTLRQRFERDGYLVVPGLVDSAACDALIARAEALVRDYQPSAMSVFSTRQHERDAAFLASASGIGFFFEEDAFGPDGTLERPVALAINKIGHAMHDLDPVFDRFSRDDRVAMLAAELGCRDPLLLQSMYIFKQPFVGGEVTVHQDQTFLWTDPPSVIGLWFALEDATLENGCLWVLPGGHSIAARRRFVRAGEGTRLDVLDPEPLPTDGMVPLQVEKGTCVVLHGLLPHRSDANRSPMSRHAYTLHLVERDADYAADNWLQRAPELPLRGF